MSKRLASSHRSAKRTHAFYFAARNASLAFLQFFLSLVDSFPTVLPRQYAEMRKKKVGILRTSGTSMFSGFLSVIFDDSLCPHSEYCLPFFFFLALLQFMSPPLSKKEALTCCDAQYFILLYIMSMTKNAFSTKLAFWVDFSMRRETGKPEGNRRFRLALTETQPTNNRRDESPD